MQVRGQQTLLHPEKDAQLAGLWDEHEKRSFSMMAGAHNGVAMAKAAVESSTGDEGRMRRPLNSVPGFGRRVSVFSVSGEGRAGGSLLSHRE